MWQALLPLALLASSDTATQALARLSCNAVRDSVAAQRGVQLQPGRYRLELIATGGSRTGRTTGGIIDLWLARPTDRSPRYPIERPPADSDLTPLWGATSIDFTAVGAPIDPRGSGWVPAPTSRDPLHPGIIALVQRAETRLPSAMLLIGTLHNRRVDDGRMGLDGPGIHLSIQRQRGDSSWGSWGPWGRLVDGSGHFCHVRLARDSG